MDPGQTGVVQPSVLEWLSPMRQRWELAAVLEVLGFFLALAGMVVAYLVLIEFAKRLVFAAPEGHLPGLRRRGQQHRVQRRAAQFSTSAPLSGPRGTSPTR